MSDLAWISARPDVIEMPTVRIPWQCMCTWTVTRPGPGEACISQLNRASRLCPVRHSPEQPGGRQSA